MDKDMNSFWLNYNGDMFFAWIIFGPTASGKSARALAMAKEKGADILSFDSRQIYKGMSIASGQDVPDGYVQIGDGSFQLPQDASAPRLFGLNLVEPDQEYSVRHFYEYARKIISDHRADDKPLVIVGGSWPYAQVMIDPPATLLLEVDRKLRQRLASLPVEQLQKELRVSDPARFVSMNESDRKNPRRLIRAIESGRQSIGPLPPPLLTNREYSLSLHSLGVVQLEENIKKRIDDRIAQGVLEETRSLIRRFPDWSLPAFSATGYVYVRQHLEGKISLEETKRLWFFQERQYAKRQLTWLKKLQTEKRYNITE